MMSSNIRRFEWTATGLTFNATIPRRATELSACYDLYPLSLGHIYPNETVKIPTGIKVHMPSNEIFVISMRSSLAFRGLTMPNAPGIIDADYYNNPDNEGEISLLIHNGSPKLFEFDRETRLCQGMFIEYKKVDDDVPLTSMRSGGFGSTGV